MSKSEGLTVKLQGGLGNQLFGWATGFRIANEKGLPLYLDTSLLIARKYELDSFGIQNELSNRAKSSELKSKLASRIGVGIGIREKSFNFDSSVLKAGKGDVLNGYFQSWKYFDPVKDQIQLELKLKQESVSFKKVHATLEGSDFTAIHVRRGDYKNLQNYHGLTSKRYFEDSLRICSSHTDSQKIVVFSDDIVEARQTVPAADLYIGNDEELSPAETMLLMAEATNFIGSNSSFSWWACYLNKSNSGVKIFPRPWFSEKTINTSDLLPDSWITIGI